MPKTIYLPDSPDAWNGIEWHKSSGIEVTWYKTRGDIRVNGWYDNEVGIAGERLSLRDFFARLGITEKDCARAFRKESTP